MKTGNILLFAHTLANPITVENSVFTTLKSVAISSMRVKTVSNAVSEVSFINCTFKNSSSTLQSLIRISARATVSFTGSTFESISLNFDRSGIIESSSNSITKFTKTNFTKNSAVTSTLFLIESGAYVECNY